MKRKKNDADGLPRGAQRTVILSLLFREGPLHGYALSRALEEKTGGRFQLREGSLYPILHELELERLVEASWDRSPEGRKRRVYRLTAGGKREAKAMKKRWLEVAGLIEALLGEPSSA